MLEAAMEDLLFQLLTRLEAIGQDHEELSDTESREAMRRVVFKGFLKPDPSFSMPTDFGLEDDESNQAIGDAIARYIQAASIRATNKMRQLAWHSHFISLDRIPRPRRYCHGQAACLR
jgi:hypothetical protein